MSDTNKKYLDLPGLQAYHEGVKQALQNIQNNIDNISYNNLKDKPKINDVELSGNKTSEQLGINAIDEIDILAILDPE